MLKFCGKRGKQWIFIKIFTVVTILLIIRKFFTAIVSLGPPSITHLDSDIAVSAFSQPATCLDGKISKGKEENVRFFFKNAHNEGKNNLLYLEKCRRFLSSALFVKNKTLLTPFRNVVINIQRWIEFLYFTSVRNSGSADCQPRFLQYMCEPKSTCGGFGDRVRGMVSLFYLALLSNRIFYIHWLSPVDLAHYFRINGRIYGIDDSLFLPKVQHPTYFKRFMDNKIGEAFSRFLGDSNFTAVYDHDITIAIATNLRKVVDGGPFTNRHFLPTACHYFSEFPYIEDVTETALFAAAQRVLLGQPTERLLTEYNFFLATIYPSKERNRLWNLTFKIGIQIRFERSDWSEQPDRRVSFDQISCFVWEAVRIAGLEGGNVLNNGKRILVFVTSSDSNATKTVVHQLKERNIHGVAVMAAPVLHVDRYEPWSEGASSLSRSEILRGNAKVMLDWYILTQMDYLIISNSGFGKSASYMSLVPTRVFHDRASAKSTICEFSDMNFLTF